MTLTYFMELFTFFTLNLQNLLCILHAATSDGTSHVRVLGAICAPRSGTDLDNPAYSHGRYYISEQFI